MEKNVEKLKFTPVIMEENKENVISKTKALVDIDIIFSSFTTSLNI